MPSDVANLDELLSRRSNLALRQRLQGANKASDILSDMNWEQEKCLQRRKLAYSVCIYGRCLASWALP